MRTLSYTNFSRGSRVECENLVLTCMDFRFRKHVAELINHAGYRDFDILALPGASRAIVEEKSREMVFHAVELAIRLHQVKRVIIVDHEDCGTCGGSAAFPCSEDEEKFHADSLRAAADLLRRRFGGIEVIPAYMDWQQIRVVG